MTTDQTILQLTRNTNTRYTLISPDMRTLGKLQELIEQSFWWNRSTTYYSDELGLSLKCLNRITCFYLNQSVHELLQNRIHQEAEYQLEHTQHSVKEIAYMLGCSDVSYFCRCFKQHTGKTPKEWRRETRTTRSI